MLNCVLTIEPTLTVTVNMKSCSRIETLQGPRKGNTMFRSLKYQIWVMKYHIWAQKSKKNRKKRNKTFEYIQVHIESKLD